MLLFLLSLGFLEKAPTEYLCSYVDDPPDSAMRRCIPADFCNNPKIASFEPDTSHKDYYDNLFTKFDLHCADSS